jgi:cellulose synthase/poly-beta-1,6-N-acetylglucosamine synthase-like glycosyltransferase
MLLFIAWLLVGSSAFVSLFYLYIHLGSEEESFSRLDSWPSVSILVPAYNEEDVVSESLENLLNLDYPHYEVIFINDNSSDGTLESACEYSSDYKMEIVDLEENRGKAGALNEGLERAQGEFAVVQDADSVIEEGIIKDAVSKMSAKPELGAVIGRIRPLKGNSFFRKLQITEYTVTNFYRKLMCSIDTLDVTPGAFSIYRTEDLRDVGGFDEGNLTEDLDMAWRLRKKGRSLDMVYHRSSHTELPKTFSDLKGQGVRWARGFIYNARKHVDMFFNKEYGWFGRFQLPLHAVVPAIAVLGLGMILSGLLERVYNAYLQFSAVGLTLNLGQLELWKILLSIQWKVYIPLAMSLLVTGYLIRVAYNRAGRTVQHPASLLFYFFAFFAFKAYFWSTAIFKELFRMTKVWT